MSAPEMGARVLVSFEGVVTQSDGSDRFDVLPNDAIEHQDGHAESVLWVRGRHCTVLAAPLRVGQEVTPQNMGQLPQWSVVAFPDGPSWTLFNVDDWRGYMDEPLSSLGLLSGARTPPRVLRIGGTW